MVSNGFRVARTLVRAFQSCRCGYPKLPKPHRALQTWAAAWGFHPFFFYDSQARRGLPRRIAVVPRHLLSVCSLVARARERVLPVVFLLSPERTGVGCSFLVGVASIAAGLATGVLGLALASWGFLPWWCGGCHGRPASTVVATCPIHLVLGLIT